MPDVRSQTPIDRMRRAATSRIARVRSSTSALDWTRADRTTLARTVHGTSIGSTSVRCSRAFEVPIRRSTRRRSSRRLADSRGISEPEDWTSQPRAARHALRFPPTASVPRRAVSTTFAFLEAELRRSRRGGEASARGAGRPRTAVLLRPARRSSSRSGGCYEYDRALPLPYEDKLSALLNEPSFKALANGQRVHGSRRRSAGSATGPCTSEAAVTSSTRSRSSRRCSSSASGWPSPTAAASKPAAGLKFDPQVAAEPAHASEHRRRRSRGARSRRCGERRPSGSALEPATSRADARGRAARACAPRSPRRRRRARRCPTTHDYSEAETRDFFIDLLLARGRLAARPGARPRVRGHRDAQRPGRGLRRLRAVGRRRQAARRSSRPSAPARDPRVGQQQAKLYADCLESAVRPAAGHLLHQRLRALDLGRHRLPAAAGAGLPHQGRAGAADPAPHHARAARPAAEIDRAIVERYYQQRAIRRIAEAFETDKRAQGAAGHGHRRRQDPHRHRARRPADAGQLGEAGAVPRRPHRAGEPGRQRLQGAPARLVAGQPRDRDGTRTAASTSRPTRR